MTSTSQRRALLCLMIVASPVVAQTIHPGIGVRVRAPSVLLERFEGTYVGSSADTLLLGNDDSGPIQVGRIVRLDAPTLALKGFQGTYLGGTKDTLLVSTRKGGAMKVPAAAITRLEVRGGRDRTGFAVLGAGASIAAVLLSGQDMRASDVAGDFALVAIGGAMIGGVVGSVVGNRRWTRVDPRLLVRPVIKEEHGPALRLALRL